MQCCGYMEDIKATMSTHQSASGRQSLRLHNHLGKVADPQLESPRLMIGFKIRPAPS